MDVTDTMDVPMVEAVNAYSQVPIASTRTIFCNHSSIANKGITPIKSNATLLADIEREQTEKILPVDLAIAVQASKFKRHYMKGLMDSSNFMPWSQPKKAWVDGQAAIISRECELVNNLRLL